MEWAEVRALAQDGVSQREIARRSGINRRTVARFVAADRPPRYVRPSPGSQLDPLVDAIVRALEESPGIKAPRMTELLREEHGYEGSVDLVRRRLAALRARDERLLLEARRRPGQVVEFDWVEMPTRTWMHGVRRSVYALVASLPFSGTQTAHFSFDLTIESFLEGHVRVFDWLGGVPRECVYHNLRPLIAKRDSRQAVRWNARFRELRSHYDFRSTVYLPPAVPEKYSLAGAVGYLQRGFWTTMRFPGFAELDGLYAAWRDNVAHPLRDASGRLIVAESLREERAALRALPSEHFDFSLQRTVRVPRDGYIRHAASYYRAPRDLVDRRVDLHVTRGEVWMVRNGLRVASYPRSYKPGMRLPVRRG